MKLTPTQHADLAELDDLWQGGDVADPTEVARAVVQWRALLGRQASPAEERFDIVDPEGAPLGWTAPRWFCHLTGLRHRVAHILLTSPQGMLVLQMRAGAKAEWPMHFDTTVGGHLKAGWSWPEGALSELAEEMGIGPEALVEGALTLSGQPYERYDVVDVPGFLRNRQLNQLFTGTLSPEGLSQIHFPDAEVAGIYLCARAEVAAMIEADFHVAPGLRHAFPRLK